MKISMNLGLCFLALGAGVKAQTIPPAAAERPRVTVDSGPLIGAMDRETRSFKGIPYARPPIGPLRFKPPETPVRWKDPLDASGFGAACPQDQPIETAAGPGVQNEDCLSLNVWAPADPAAKKAPVMVWIHGGGNTAGSSSRRYYDGSSFAKDGVVLVSINYRLGRLGFFAHPDLTKAAKPDEPLANYGLLDQIAALQWVKRNIAVFGGDPGNVTLFGESAGGEDTLVLMTANAATGLFQKAIVESGGGWRPLPTLAEAEKVGALFVAAHGVASKGASAPVRSVSINDLIKEPADLGPIVDGRLLTSSITRAFRASRAAAIPLMIGTNSDEGSLVGQAPPEGMLKQLSAEQLTKARAAYGPGVDDAMLARFLFRDLNFTAPARWIARHASPSAPVFLYRFTHLRRSQRGRVPGAAHGSELPYVFSSWHQSPSGGLLAKEDLDFATTVHGCWVAFARTGVPACPTPWAPYRAESDEIVELGSDVAAKPDPLRAVLDFVDAFAKR